MRFSLKIVSAVTAILCVFFALVRISDVASALMFMLMICWMLSPVLVTFGVLYWRLKGGCRRRGQRRVKR